jgi:hypothetical protein
MPPPYSSQSGSAPIEIEAGNGHQTNQDLDPSSQSNLGEQRPYHRRNKRSHHKPHPTHSSRRRRSTRSSKSQVPATDLFNRDEPKSLSLFALISQRWQKSLEAAKQETTRTKEKSMHRRSPSDKENDPSFFSKSEISQSCQLNTGDELTKGNDGERAHKKRGRRHHREADRQHRHQIEYRSKSRASAGAPRHFLRQDMPRYYDERDDSENRVQPLR